jgi:hypothetical protein
LPATATAEHKVKVLYRSIDALWYSSAGSRLLRIVTVRDPGGRRRDDCFFSTDLTLKSPQILETFALRWPLYVTASTSVYEMGGVKPQGLEIELHADVGGLEAQPFVEAAGVGSCLVAGELYEMAAAGARLPYCPLDHLGSETLASEVRSNSDAFDLRAPCALEGEAREEAELEGGDYFAVEGSGCDGVVGVGVDGFEGAVVLGGGECGFRSIHGILSEQGEDGGEIGRAGVSDGQVHGVFSSF